MSDFRMTALTVKLSEIQPKLDDLYIRVLPTLEEIKSRQRKEEDMERLEEREDKDHIQKILDIVEDLKEQSGGWGGGGAGGGGEMSGGAAGGGGGRLEQILEDQGSKMEQVLSALCEVRSYTAKEGSVGRIEKQLDEMGKMHGKVNTLLNVCTKEKELKKVVEAVNELRTNSMTDAKALSQINTALQV